MKRRETVLVLDDEAGIHLALREFFGVHGFEVLEAERCEEASIFLRRARVSTPRKKEPMRCFQLVTAISPAPRPNESRRGVLAPILRNLALVLAFAVLSGALMPLVADTGPTASGPTVGHIELAGAWRVRAGDDPNWAASQLDDTAWRTVVLPGSWKEQGLKGFAGPIWYRRAVNLKASPTGSASEGWGLLVGRTRFGTVDVWINGVSVCSVGGPTRPVPVPALRAMAIPKTAVEGHDRLVVAIRVTRAAWASDRTANGGPVGDDLALAPFRDLVDHVELDRHRELIASLPMLVASLVFLAAALGFSYLWMRWRFGVEHLWFGLVAFGFAANTFLNSPWVFEVTDQFPLVIRLTEISGVLLPGAFIQFLWTYLNRPLPALLRVYQGSFGALAVAIAVSPGLGWVVDTQGLRWLWLVPLLGCGLYAVISEVRRDSKAARSIVLVGVLLAGAELLAIVGSLMHWIVPLALEPAWVFGAFVLVMGAVLADRLSRMRAELADRVATLALAREALRESESRLRLVLDNTSELLALWSVEDPGRFRVAATNRAFVEFLHSKGVALGSEELVGLSFEEIQGGIVGLGREALEADRLRLVEVAVSLRSMAYELTVDSPLGRSYFDITVCPVLDETGACTHLLRTLRDVTERVQITNRLKQSEERFSRAFRSSPVPMTISRLSDGHVTDANEAFGAMIEPGRGDPVYDGFFDLAVLTDPGDQDRLAVGLAERHSVRDQEIRLRSSDGGVIVARYSAEVVDLGGASCLLSVFLDITEQKRAEATVKMLAQAVRSVNQCVSITDRNNRIIFVNEAFLQTFGYNESELVGQPIDIVRSPAQPTPTPAVIMAATLDGGWEGELVNRRKDGSEFPIFLSSSVVHDDSGVPIGLIGVATDITERKRTEEALRRQDSMSEMGSLVGGVAHEVRNPLFAITGLLDALDARFGGEHQFTEFLRGLRSEADRLVTLMHSLLEYGRPVSDERLPTRLNLVAREAVRLCQREASSRGVELCVDVAEDLPRVPLDQPRMTEAFRNIVENGVLHSPPGGAVVIAARLLEERSGWLEVQIRDSGPGFNEADMARVFEPFFSRRAGGTGLGLSIVHRVVTAHSGAVEASNHAGGGGVVTVTLPL